MSECATAAAIEITAGTRVPQPRARWVAHTPGMLPALRSWIRDRRAWLAVHDQVRATATWSDGRCTWCDATARHRGPDGVVQAPAVFHQTEITAEAVRRAAV